MDYDSRHNLAVSEPAAAPRGVVLVLPAMATPARFYQPFATWLACRGLRAVVMEHRGSVGSAVRAHRGDLLEWFEDARDALNVVADHSGDLPVTWVGHSLGAQMLPFVAHERLAAAVSVASGQGWVRHLPGHLRWTAPVLFRTVAPLAIRVTGYYPGRRLRLLDDLPGEVMLQWARWCLDRDYMGADIADAAARFAAVRTPITAVSFTDDRLMSAASTASLHDRFVNAEVTQRRYRPADLGVSAVGHHGIFRARHAHVWDEVFLPHLATVNGTSARAAGEPARR